MHDSMNFGDPDSLPSMDQVEKDYILRVLDACGGEKIRACRILRIDRKTLYRKILTWGEDWRLSARRPRTNT
jgi:DNA-binding NtrC family response regulator